MKRIIVWIAIITLIFAGVFAMNACDRKDKNGVAYQLNLNNFDGIVAYGESMDLSCITITKTENEVSTEIPVDVSMVTTHVDTSRIGAQLLKFNYAGQSFMVPVIVKYKIQYEIDGTALKTFYVLKKAELEEVTPPEKSGYTFSGWSSEIPDIIFENMTLSAIYAPEIPELSELSATYGDQLASVHLPYTAAGAWQFDNAEGTVGDAGKRTFAVSFVEYETGEALATDTVTVNVAKREVKIDVFADFTYNGTRQEPTYTTDVPGIKVSSWPDSDKNYTDAGEYNYYFEVDDPNYKGEAKGTYVIKPAVVTVQINSYEIKANEAIPEAGYKISGFEGMSEEKIAELIGLSIVYPETVTVGEYQITATASNPSIYLDVEEGTLTVVSATLGDIGEPQPLDGSSWVATYGDLLGSIEFASHPNGRWVWETPAVEVGEVGKQTYSAVFIPSNSAFEQIRCDVEITVLAKPMDIEIVGNTTFDYDGTEHKVSFTVKDKDGNTYDDLEVAVVVKDRSGNILDTPCKNAGVYTVELTLSSPNYSATKVVTLTINKVDPTADFDQILTTIWSATLKLSDVKLPEGYAWDNPDKRIEKAGTASYAVTFTPSDTVNYNTKTGELKVEVAKATATIQNVKDSYTSVYNGDVYTITGVTASNNGALVYTYEDGTPFTGVTDAGTYTVIITLPESDNYNKAEVTTTVTIDPAANTDTVTFSQSAIYGDLALKVIKLPTSTTGTWSIEDVEETTTVGNVGARKFTLHFTPANGNYTDRREEITVNVAKASVGILDKYENVLPETDNRPSQSYNGQAFTLPEDVRTSNGVSLNPVIKKWNAETQKYDISVDEIENIGRYTITYSYAGDDNHKGATVAITVEITKATINFNSTPTVEENLIYDPNKTVSRPTVTVEQDFVSNEEIYFEYRYSENEGATWTDWMIWNEATQSASDTGIPTDAGMYQVRARVTANENYANVETVVSTVAAFTIEKAPAVITVNGHSTTKDYDGIAVIPPEAEADNGANVTVKINGKTPAEVEIKNFGTYTITYSYAGDNNYQAAETKTITVTINKATVTISAPTIDDEDWTYGIDARKPNVGFNQAFAQSYNSQITFKYYSDAECKDEDEIPVPTKTTGAGTYYVKAVFTGNNNLNAATSAATAFTIAKANASIEGVDVNTTYGKVYDGTPYVFPSDIKGSYNGAPAVEYAEIINNGEYTVTITLPESDNYNSATVEGVKVKIDKAENKQTVSQATEIFYGDLVLNKITLPENIEGTWHLETADSVVVNGTTTFTGAVQHKFVAVFTPDATGNYDPCSIEITVNVKKAPVDVPNVGNFGYDGQPHAPTLTDTDDYTVEENVGGIDHGSYTVTLKLRDPANREWKTSLTNVTITGENNELVTITYAISEAPQNWDVKPTITEKWQYERADEYENPYGYAKAEHGDVDIYYKPYDANDDAYSKTRPQYPGKYIARFVTTDANYDILTVELTFEITPRRITPPVDTKPHFTYTGDKDNLIKSGLTDGFGYTIIGDVGSINVGEYTVMARLTSQYYVWDNGDETSEDKADRTFTYYIDPAQIVISNLGISNGGWEFDLNNANANDPDYDLNITEDDEQNVEVTFTYYYEDGTPVGGVPTQAGKYYVTAQVTPKTGYNNLTASEVETSEVFEITKAAATLEGVSDDKTYTSTYDENGYNIENVIRETHDLALDFSYFKDDEPYNGAIKDAGTYTVVITLDESDANYGNYHFDPVTVTIVIDKATVTLADQYKSQTATYAQSVSVIALPQSDFGVWSIKEKTLGDAGVNKTFTAVFTSNSKNHEDNEVEITVTVNKAPLTFSGNTNRRETYKNGKFDVPTVTASSGVTPTVTINGPTPEDVQIWNAGTYTITYTFAESDNYLGGSVEVIVVIDKAPVTFSNLSITDWEYHPDNANKVIPTVKVDQTFVDSSKVYFQYAYLIDEETDTWSDWITWTDENAPIAAGNYRVRAAVEEGNNYNASFSGSKDFEITVVSVTVPNKADIEKSFTYNGNVQKPTVATNDYYTITWSNADSENFGTYTVTLTLNDAASSEWDTNVEEEKTSNKVYTYTIAKAPITFTVESVTTEKDYDGNAITPPRATASNGADVTVLINGKKPSEVVIMNAGTYTITYNIPESDNYLAATEQTVTIIINKVTPTWEDVFTNGKFYQNRVEVAFTTLKAYNGTSEVPGKFTVTSTTFSTTEGQSKVTVTFTPTEAQGVDNYVDSCSMTYDTTFVAVAYLNNTTAYGTIEAALAAATTSGDVVWVRPYDTTLGPIYIMSDVEIKSGVTLLLPYGVNGDGRNTYTDNVANFDLHGGGCSEGNHGTGHNLAGDTLCHVQVILAAGKTITNNGTLEVSGQLSGGGAGAPYAGHTAGEHAKLILGADAKIYNYGVIRAAGFIREEVKDNGSSITVYIGATLYQPYVLKDYASGQYLYGPYKLMQDGTPMTPFNMFVFMNVSPTVTINYGGSMVAWAALYTGSNDGINTTSTTFIGTGGVIEFTTEQSYLTAKYDPDNEKCKLDVYGGAKTNSMTLPVSLAGVINVTIDTNDCLFPITYLHDITLHNGDYTMAQRYKMMPGAKLTVAADANLTIGTLIVYDETFVDGRSTNSQLVKAHLYPTGKGAAVFTVNGTATVGTLGGRVQTTTAGAMVTINTATTYTAYEPKSYEDAKDMVVIPYKKIVSSYSIKQDAVLMNADATGVIPAPATTCEYVNGAWRTSLKLHFDSNGGGTEASVDIFSNEAYPTLPTPTREHYEFAGWKDANGNIVTQGSALPAVKDAANGITLTAQWTPKNYNLKYEWKFEGFATDPTIAWAESLGTFNIETATITLPTPTNDAGSFAGWYTDAACTQLIINISGAKLIALHNGDATIYGLWTNQQYTIKFEGDEFDDVPYTNDTVVYTPSTLPSATLPTIPNTYETDVTVDKYFEGWYYNGAKVTDFSFINDSTSEYTLTANWVDKVSITYTASNTSIYTNLITNGSETLAYGTTYWYKSGTTITLANVTANDNVVTDSSKLNYCKSWTLNDADFDKSKANTAYTLSENTVIHITWGTKTTIKVDWTTKGTDQNNPDAVDAVYKLLVSSTGTDDGQYSTDADFVTNKDTTYYVIPEHYIKFEVTSCIEDGTTVPRDAWEAVTETTYAIWNRPKYSTCIVEGTLITLADGTQKKVEDLTHDDLLLIFNHETGKMETGYIAMLDHLDMERMWANVINFTFSNGETLRMVWSHGVFDATLNKYVLVNEDNYSEFVGHEFYSTYYNGSEFVSELVTLTDAFITNEYIRVYNPTSYWHMNYFSNGILNVTAAPADHVGGHVNIFELDEDMKYDAEQMQADIEKYGLYTYDDFAEYLTEEQFYALPFAYLKVAVGKGNIDWESIMQIVEYIKAGSLLD